MMSFIFVKTINEFLRGFVVCAYHIIFLYFSVFLYIFVPYPFVSVLYTPSMTPKYSSMLGLPSLFLNIHLSQRMRSITPNLQSRYSAYCSFLLFLFMSHLNFLE